MPRWRGRPISRRSGRPCTPGDSAEAGGPRGCRGRPGRAGGSEAPTSERPDSRRPCDVVHRGPTAGVPPLRLALRGFRREEALMARDVRWLLLAPLVRGPVGRRALVRAHDARAAGWRDTGALRVLPAAATYRACLHVHAGSVRRRSWPIEEADAIAVATGPALLRLPSVMLAAWRGSEAETLGSSRLGSPCESTGRRYGAGGRRLGHRAAEQRLGSLRRGDRRGRASQRLRGLRVLRVGPGGTDRGGPCGGRTLPPPR